MEPQLFSSDADSALTLISDPDPGFSVVEPQGAGTFGRSRSWCRYTEVPAPTVGQTKKVYLILIHIE